MVFDRLLTNVAPNRCVSCKVGQSILCSACRFDLNNERPESCYRCNRLSQGNKTCRSCRRSVFVYSVDYATEYQDLAKKLVHAAKIDVSHEAIRVIASMMNDDLPYFDVDYVINVPTASSRVRQRGFDHGRMLADELARFRRLRSLNALSRTNQVRQLGADRQTRRKQLDGAIFARPRARILSGQSVLLVDDVMSTGASIEAAASELKRIGVKRVYVAVFARNF